jgi:hypothetical protein
MYTPATYAPQPAGMAPQPRLITPITPQQAYVAPQQAYVAPQQAYIPQQTGNVVIRKRKGLPIWATLLIIFLGLALLIFILTRLFRGRRRQKCPAMPLTLTQGPTNTSTNTVTFIFAHEAPVEASLDNGKLMRVESPVILKNLSPGPHTWTLQYVGCPLTSLTQTWKVAPPGTTFISQGPNLDTVETSARFEFFGPGPVFEASLDDGPFEVKISPVTYSSLALGPHTFRVRSVGTGSPSEPAVWEWTIVGPNAPVIRAGPSGNNTSTQAQFDFVSSGNGPFECSLDGQAYTQCSSPMVYTKLSYGQHTFSVRDKGTMQSTQQKWTVVSPNQELPSLKSGPTDTTNESAATFTVDGDPHVEYSLNSGSWTRGMSPLSFMDLPEGEHHLRLRYPGQVKCLSHVWQILPARHRKDYTEVMSRSDDSSIFGWERDSRAISASSVGSGVSYTTITESPRHHKRRR